MRRLISWKRFLSVKTEEEKQPYKELVARCLFFGPPETEKRLKHMTDQERGQYRYYGAFRDPSLMRCNAEDPEQCRASGCVYRRASPRRRDTCAQPPRTLGRRLLPSEVDFLRSGSSTEAWPFERVAREARLSSKLQSGRYARRRSSVWDRSSQDVGPRSLLLPTWYDAASGRPLELPSSPFDEKREQRYEATMPETQDMEDEEEEDQPELALPVDEKQVEIRSLCSVAEELGPAEGPFNIECFSEEDKAGFAKALKCVKDQWNLCAFELQKGYGVSTATTVLLARDRTKKKQPQCKLKGFALLQEDADPERRALVISTLCAKGAGRELLGRAEELARGAGYEYLEIDATINALAFYHKLGFRHAKSAECTESTDVAKLVGQLEVDLAVHKEERLQKQKKGQEAPRVTYPSSKDILEWPTMQNLLTRLVADRLVADENCAGIGIKQRSDPTGTDECGVGGYRMVKCLS